MTLLAWTFAALQTLPTYHEDRGNPHKPAQEALIAHAIAEAASNRHEAALLLTVGSHETNFAYRIHAGMCRPLECDRGKAVGIFQAHKNGRPEEVWRSFGSFQGTNAAARAAMRDLRRAQNLCRSEPDEIASTLSAYVGLGCRGRSKTTAERVATYQRLMAR